jgi:hypothetical protein
MSEREPPSAVARRRVSRAGAPLRMRPRPRRTALLSTWSPRATRSASAAVAGPDVHRVPCDVDQGIELAVEAGVPGSRRSVTRIGDLPCEIAHGRSLIQVTGVERSGRCRPRDQVRGPRHGGATRLVGPPASATSSTQLAYASLTAPAGASLALVPRGLDTPPSTLVPRADRGYSTSGGVGGYSTSGGVGGYSAGVGWATRSVWVSRPGTRHRARGGGCGSRRGAGRRR